MGSVPDSESHSEVNILCAGGCCVAAGRERRVAWVFGWSLVGDLLLNAVLIPPFGIVGAAGAAATTVVIRNALLAGYVLRDGMDPTALGFRRSGVSGP